MDMPRLADACLSESPIKLSGIPLFPLKSISSFIKSENSSCYLINFLASSSPKTLNTLSEMS
jgi:hypothetical protein